MKDNYELAELKRMGTKRLKDVIEKVHGFPFYLTPLTRRVEDGIEERGLKIEYGWNIYETFFSDDALGGVLWSARRMTFRQVLICAILTLQGRG